MEFMGHQVHGITDIILGATAVVASFALHLYPIPTFRRIKRQESTNGELLNYYPYYATHLACLLWLCYSIPTKGSTLAFHKYCLLNINTCGLMFQIAYLILYLEYKHEEREDIRFLAIHEFFWTVLVPLMLPSWYNAITGPEKSKYLGPAAVIFGCIMHASHLPTIINAYEIGRPNNLPFGMCTIYLLDAVAWFAYGYAYTPTYDVYVAIANGVGIALEVVQLILCLVFFKKLRNSDASQDFPTNDPETPLLEEIV